jgi:hypothetical protein
MSFLDVAPPALGALLSLSIFIIVMLQNLLKVFCAISTPIQLQLKLAVLLDQVDQDLGHTLKLIYGSESHSAWLAWRFVCVTSLFRVYIEKK